MDSKGTGYELNQIYIFHVEYKRADANVPVNKIITVVELQVGFDLHRAGSTGGMRLKTWSAYSFSFLFFLSCLSISLVFFFFGFVRLLVLFFCISLYLFVRLREITFTEGSEVKNRRKQAERTDRTQRERENINEKQTD